MRSRQVVQYVILLVELLQGRDEPVRKSQLARAYSTEYTTVPTIFRSPPTLSVSVVGRDACQGKGGGTGNADHAHTDTSPSSPNVAWRQLIEHRLPATPPIASAVTDSMTTKCITRHVVVGRSQLKATGGCVSMSLPYSLYCTNIREYSTGGFDNSYSGIRTIPPSAGSHLFVWTRR